MDDEIVELATGCTQNVETVFNSGVVVTDDDTGERWNIEFDECTPQTTVGVDYDQEIPPPPEKTTES